MKRKYPGFTQQQIDYLDELYPEQAPALADGDRKIWFDVGCRHVVRSLITKHKEQLKQSNDL